ncbi:hypothetical protein NTE_00064 [Candidatus Nitrososphaera evergladensis SR1]|uniref:Uncharacterized protein n=1 Tax=Candidatus Nitrososphaera evergladensis SR1 TaxID=1459636 RepID=A0A075MLK2_9ARCH|nr:putative glycolipid-binding domain-containing protein [Candidatus Nitrososphaera evergladensis]AIF82148.1 hypothetical protein NTE_00064 [Candidatus Nitrososphaera evergladensis SR1]
MTIIVARWHTWAGDGWERLVLEEGPDGIIAESVLERTAYSTTYRIACDRSWRTREVKVRLLTGGKHIDLASDGSGNWTDDSGGASGAVLPYLSGSIDVDLSATPFTNTIPIRRLGLKLGESKDVSVAYVSLPDLAVTADLQRYTCIEPGRLYRYESVDGNFSRDIEVDEHGLVVTYPGLFKRV